MINARAQAFDALDNSSDRVEGILEIQSSSIPAVTFLPELLAGFRTEHSGIQYYVSSSDTQTVIDNITPEELRKYVEYANRAAALTCSRPGAMPAMPTKEEMEEPVK